MINKTPTPTHFFTVDDIDKFALDFVFIIFFELKRVGICGCLMSVLR